MMLFESLIFNLLPAAVGIMPKVAEQVAKPLTAVDSIKMYGSGNAQKLVKETSYMKSRAKP